MRYILKLNGNETPTLYNYLLQPMDLTALLEPDLVICYLIILITLISQHFALLFIRGKTGIVYRLLSLYCRYGWQFIIFFPTIFLVLGCLVAVGGDISFFTFIKACVLFIILMSPLTIIYKLLDKYFPL